MTTLQVGYGPNGEVYNDGDKIAEAKRRGVTLPTEFTVRYRTCRQSYPCQHAVEVDGEVQRWDAVKIVACLQLSCQSVPAHFNYVLQDSSLAARVTEILKQSY